MLYRVALGQVKEYVWGHCRQGDTDCARLPAHVSVHTAYTIHVDVHTAYVSVHIAHVSMHTAFTCPCNSVHTAMLVCILPMSDSLINELLWFIFIVYTVQCISVVVCGEKV